MITAKIMIWSIKKLVLLRNFKFTIIISIGGMEQVFFYCNQVGERGSVFGAPLLLVVIIFFFVYRFYFFIRRQFFMIFQLFGPFPAKSWQLVPYVCRSFTCQKITVYCLLCSIYQLFLLFYSINSRPQVSHFTSNTHVLNIRGLHIAYQF